MIASEQNGEFDVTAAEKINSAFACPRALQELTTLTVKHFTGCYHALSSDGETIHLI